MIEINHFICQWELLRAVCGIISQSLTTSDKWARYQRGKLIMKHAKRKSELICLWYFFFFTPSVLSLVTQLWCIQSLSFLECFIGCVLLWVTSMFHLGKSESTHAAHEICTAPKQRLLLTPFCKSKLWFMEAIGCKNNLTSTWVILFVVRIWLKHHLLSLKIQYRGRLGDGPAFSERFCPRKEWNLLQNSNP